MRYRDDAEAAAVEALRQSSAAEILLRCLRCIHPTLSPLEII